MKGMVSGYGLFVFGLVELELQNLVFRLFLEIFFVNSMHVKVFSKLDCFWNSSLQNLSLG